MLKFIKHILTSAEFDGLHLPSTNSCKKKDKPNQSIRNNVCITLEEEGHLQPDKSRLKTSLKLVKED